MKSSKPPVKYRGTALPVPLIEEIKAAIKDNPNYRSMAEFIKEACRDKLREINYENNFEYEYEEEGVISKKISKKFLNELSIIAALSLAHKKGEIQEEELEKKYDEMSQLFEEMNKPIIDKIAEKMDELKNNINIMIESKTKQIVKKEMKKYQ